MNNFYLINKPTGISSFDVIRQMRKKLNIKKMGHTGTLDPLATGILLVATGNYTKLIPYFEKDTKSYRADIMLDGFSPSYDSETEISYLTPEKKDFYKENISIKNIEKLLSEKFTGNISQIPPKYSALKIGGKKAYDLAREGKDFEMKKRNANIFEISIKQFNYPLLILDIKVSAGTYIRSIANDIGEYLGTGGYLTALERTKVGSLDIKNSVLLDDLTFDNSLNLEKIFPENKFIELNKFSEEEVKKLNNGLAFLYNNTKKEKGELFVYEGKEITNIVLYDGEKIFPKRKI